MQRIAVPVMDNLLSTHFGHCQEFHLFDVENKEIKNISKEVPPPHEPGILPKWLHEQGATDVISGGMGQRAIRIFNDQKINVYVGAPIEEPEKLVKDFLSGHLPTTANMCSH